MWERHEWKWVSIEVIDNLEELEQSLDEETFAALIYNSGYVQKKNGSLKENDTMFYFKKYGCIWMLLIDIGTLLSLKIVLFNGQHFALFILFK